MSSLKSDLSDLEAVFAHQEPDAIFTALMPFVCESLDCDRCFLYLRNPQTGRKCITHCYSRSPQYPDLTEADWLEGKDEATQDPLMAIAFRTSEPVFVEDIETAGPEVVNLAYEQDCFGHRALIHAPIRHNGELYGILEPCVFEQPRLWTQGDRHLVTQIQQRLAPYVVAYLHGNE